MTIRTEVAAAASPNDSSSSHNPISITAVLMTAAMLRAV